MYISKLHNTQNAPAEVANATNVPQIAYVFSFPFFLTLISMLIKFLVDIFRRQIGQFPVVAVITGLCLSSGRPTVCNALRMQKSQNR